MKHRLIALFVFAAFTLTVTGRVALTAGPATAQADALRKVYFSAVDDKGVAVTDLTAADLTVKEGGKERRIAGIQPATAPMHVAIFVDDAGTGAFQSAVAQFFDATQGHAQYSVSIMNPQPIRVVNYTADIGPLRAAIGRLGQRGRVLVDGEQIIEAVGGAAKELQQLEAPRPIIVVLTVGGEKPLSDISDAALDNLQSSGASLHVLYVTGNTLGKVLGDGPKLSGGTIQQASPGIPLGPVLRKIADTLMHQYRLAYTIPDGVKPNERLSLTTSRKGVKIFAPTRLPDK
jgi:hypothetical protein